MLKKLSKNILESSKILQIHGINSKFHHSAYIRFEKIVQTVNKINVKIYLSCLILNKQDQVLHSLLTL